MDREIQRRGVDCARNGALHGLEDQRLSLLRGCDRLEQYLGVDRAYDLSQDQCGEHDISAESKKMGFGSRGEYFASGFPALIGRTPCNLAVRHQMDGSRQVRRFTGIRIRNPGHQRRHQV